jgi:radical SAM superfamily enzyme YgiQ (UPF0313 family)
MLTLRKIIIRKEKSGSSCVYCWSSPPPNIVTGGLCGAAHAGWWASPHTCLWTINTSRDEELLDLAKKSGCYHVNIGIENVCQDSISSIHKLQNPVKEYEDLLGRLAERDLFYSLNFMFGLDADTPELFEEDLAFLDRFKAPMAFFNVATPRQGTPMWEQLKNEGRVHNPEAVSSYQIAYNNYFKELCPCA